MTPTEQYQQALKQKLIQPDSAQKKAVRQLQKLFDILIENYDVEQGWVSRIKNRFSKTRVTPVRGIYFWGGVGRGKTFLVDMFYECLPFEEKMRMHFHRFMQMIHHELKALKDREDPLDIVADKIASQYFVICFDEFHVSDITDAMMLAGLFKGLFDRGVTLVATSNIEPDRLYWDGLQREQFLPAIKLIKKHTRVLNLDSGVDYRLEYLDKAEIYHTIIDEEGSLLLEENFNHLAPDVAISNQSINIEGREIETVRIADGVIWFEFNALCDGPRGPSDYIEIARCFQTVLIANVPSMDDHHVDVAKRFMTLVDEFYDRNVKLIITATVKPEKLYEGSRLSESFVRTVSRLHEMGTHDYLAKQHLP